MSMTVAVSPASMAHCRVSSRLAENAWVPSTYPALPVRLLFLLRIARIRICK